MQESNELFQQLLDSEKMRPKEWIDSFGHGPFYTQILIARLIKSMASLLTTKKLKDSFQ